MDSIPRKSIPETFAGADVFITGGSGFMGKVLIEKLLRSCPQVGNVFVLLRPRKGKLAKERVFDLVQVPVGFCGRLLNGGYLKRVLKISVIQQTTRRTAGSIAENCSDCWRLLAVEVGAG